MSNSDFEVLPVGSTEELVRVRASYAKLITANKQGDIAEIRKEIDAMQLFYEGVIERHAL